MTVSTLAEVVAAVQDIALTVTGVRVAPDSQPDGISIFPAVITFPLSGNASDQSYGFATELHDLAVDLLVAAGDYSKAYATGTGLLISLFRKIEQAPTLGGTVQTYNSLAYTWEGKVEVNGTQALLWRITIGGIKIQNTWT